MIYAAILLMGVIGWSRLPQELYPPITYPELTVVTRYKDAAPEEIELLVTKLVEEAVGTVSGVRRISSVSREEVSLVIAEFNWGTNMDFAGLGVREKLDLIKERLPRGSEDPVVIKYNPFNLPVLVLNLSGEMSPQELLDLGRKRIKNEVEKVDGVAVVNLSGGLEREILVEVDQGRLQANGLPISQVVEGLSKANLNYPGGTIKEAFYEYLIRTMGEFRVVPEIPSIAVGVEETGDKEPQPQETDRPEPLAREKRLAPPVRMILLKDVAAVKDTVKERSSISRFNGRENVSLSVQKQAGANTLQVAKRVKAAVEKMQASLPPGVEMTVAYDQSTQIEGAISGVSSAALQGGLLAFLVLLLFLGNVWDALNVSLAIPIAILGTTMLMFFTGTSLNVLSLGGLAFGIGLLVDASIVVVENIASTRQKGKGGKEAAVEGTEEVTSAIFGTVLTTVVVFLPLLFVVGLVGQFMKDFALTVTLSNGMSLLVSLTITTLLASLIPHGQWRSPIERWIHRLGEMDRGIVRWFLLHRWIGIGLIGLTLAGSAALLTQLDRELMPRVDQGQFIMRADLPPGTRLDVTDAVALRIERVLRALPEVKDVSVTIGSSKEKKAEELLETLGSHQAQILVNLKPLHRGWGAPPGSDLFRARRMPAVIQELKETLDREPLEGAEIEYLLGESVFKSALLAGAPIVVEVRGPDLARTERMTEEVRRAIGEVPGLYGIKTSIIPPSPETKVHVNKDRAAAYHLSVSDIALTAQTAIKGFIATKFKEEGREIDIRVRLREEDRKDLSKIRRLLVHSPLEINVPLAEVAILAVGKGPTEIQHLDQQRTFFVTAQLAGRPLSETIDEVNIRLVGLKMLPDYSAALTGENEQMKESYASLIFALLLALIFVYMVMASEFESLWQPFLIMGTIPFSLIGVAAALALTQTPISMMVGIGFLVLGGIVVDNGIVMVECVNALRSQGMSLEEACVESSVLRLRPILMTAATTVLGVLPLALGLGQGVELQGPMAITTIGGLTAATFLTLIFLPTLYFMGATFVSRFTRIPVPALEPAPALAGVPSAAVGPPPAAWLPPGEAEPLCPPAALELPQTEMPEIPEGFGGEEAVPEKPETAFFSPLEPMKEPEPPVGPPSPAPPAVPSPLNARQQQLLEHLKAHGRITRKEFVALAGASVPTAARDLKELAERGLIRGVGPLGPGRYYVLENQNLKGSDPFKTGV